MGIRHASVLAGLVLAALPVMAHHSFAAEYDEKKPITLTGTKDDSPLVNTKSVTLSDGRKVFAGSSLDGNAVK